MNIHNEPNEKEFHDQQYQVLFILFLLHLKNASLKVINNVEGGFELTVDKLILRSF